jgi:hypothetical protein
LERFPENPDKEKRGKKSNFEGNLQPAFNVLVACSLFFKSLQGIPACVHAGTFFLGLHDVIPGTAGVQG